MEISYLPGSRTYAYVLICTVVDDFGSLIELSPISKDEAGVVIDPIGMARLFEMSGEVH